MDVIKNVTWKASSQLNLFCKYILGKKGRRKSVPKFFLGKREGSFRWSLSDEVWTATCKDSYHYRVGPINNINETPSNTPISMWDSLEVSRQLFFTIFVARKCYSVRTKITTSEKYFKNPSLSLSYCIRTRFFVNYFWMLSQIHGKFVR